MLRITISIVIALSLAAMCFSGCSKDSDKSEAVSESEYVYENVGSATAFEKSDADKGEDDVVDIRVPACLASRPNGVPSNINGYSCFVFVDTDSIKNLPDLNFETSSGLVDTKLDETFFEKNDLYCISDMGCTIASTGGHGFNLKKAYIEDGYLYYQVDVKRPSAGMMTTQAFDENCLFVAVPKSSRVEKARCLQCGMEFDCVQAIMRSPY